MNPPPDDKPEPVLLIIADISGYTRYMTSNAKTLAHSQAVITELVVAIIQEIQLPLEVAKLEGDAIFLFCRKQGGLQPWTTARPVVAGKLLAFFSLFTRKIQELAQSTTCSCQACRNIDKLRLKVIVHSGEALFHRVLNFVELAGVDVIIAHRLLKNSVNAHQYLLLTEVAARDVQLSAEIPLAAGRENYEDIGQIKTLVFLPDGPAADAAPAPFGRRFANSWGLFRKLWFAPFARRAEPFRNLSSGGNPVGRTAFAALTILLTPVFLPVGMVFAFLHALKPAAPGHVHKADGSCCHPH
jgi:hypothetical protein